MADAEALLSPTSVQSADDGLMQSASNRHLAAQRDLSPPYGSTASSDLPTVESGINDVRPSNIGTPFEFESVVPLSPQPPREDAYDILALDPSRSIDLVANLEQSTTPAAPEPEPGPTRDGYLSDNQIERAPWGNLEAEDPPFLPSLVRGRTRRRGHAALKNALAKEGTIAPGQPGLVRRVRDKEMNVELFDQYSDEVCDCVLCVARRSLIAQ